MSKQPDDVRASIFQRFTKTAVAPQREQKFPHGPESARQLGYAAAEIDALPSSVTESFCGVGNPLGLVALEEGETVVDVGCGAGLDSLLAGRRVGATGKVIGLDMTEAMIEKARRNGRLLGADNVAFVQSEIDGLPLPDGSADVVISNGAFNLCVDKPKVLAEIHRVLRPGGRLQMADILLHDEVTPEEVASKGAWSD
jgi:arsenite methyltransferase